VTDQIVRGDISFVSGGWQQGLLLRCPSAGIRPNLNVSYPKNDNTQNESQISNAKEKVIAWDFRSHVLFFMPTAFSSIPSLAFFSEMHVLSHGRISRVSINDAVRVRKYR